MSIDRKRGFLRPESTQDSESIQPQAWGLPDYAEGESAKETALNYDPSWSPDFEETEQHELRPFTQEELENIRQDAYQEGLFEGKEAGFKQGYEKGKAEGIEAGHIEGLELGKAEGLESSQQTVDEHITSFVELASQFASPLELMNSQVERQLVDMVLTLVKEVVHLEVTTNPQILLDTVKESVESLPVANHTIELKLNPEDVELVRQAYGEEDLEQRNWSLSSEPSLTRGDVQIVAGESSVSYRMEDRVRSVLQNFCSSNRHVGGE
ncbi:flagellar assembly protein FliH [Vibrio sp. RC27]